METDFWKDKLNFYQQKNMTKKDGQRIDMIAALKEIESFKKNFPDIQNELLEQTSYISWEAYITNDLKLRFYLQTQIKISFMKKIDGVFTKIADAKFPYNPFPEITDLFSNIDDYLAEYDGDQIQNKQNKMKMKITYQFIKALAEKKFGGKKMYQIECNEKDFTLILGDYNSNEKYTLTIENFKDVINSL